MNEKILIAGGSGLVGNYLASILVNKGYEVCFLSRSKSNSGNIKCYFWNPDLRKIDLEAFRNCKYIINLAGTNISQKRWTNTQKNEILKSRIAPANFLFSIIKENNFPIEAYITASAIGYYGSSFTNTIFTETDSAGNDFLAKTCAELEKECNLFESLKIRTVKIRTGIVLAKDGGALAKMIIPLKNGIGAPLGTGKQYFPWIHITDLCQIYLKTIEDKNINGVYNAVAPNYINNNDVTKQIAKQLNKPLWLPNIPGFILKIFVGEMAQILLNGSRISAQKIIDKGFVFQFNNLEMALKDLL